VKTKIKNPATEEQVDTIKNLCPQVFESDEEICNYIAGISNGRVREAERLKYDEAERLIDALSWSIETDFGRKANATEMQISAVNFKFSRSSINNAAKKNIIELLTDGRTNNVEQLTFSEAQDLINDFPLIKENILNCESKRVNKQTKRVIQKSIKDEQIGVVNNLLKKLDLSESQKACFINKYTDGRVSNPKYLTLDEAYAVIKHLLRQLPWRESVKYYGETPVTASQIKKIHILLRQKGLMDQKEAMLHSFSDGVASSTKDLTYDEAKQWIAFLMDDQAETQNKQKAIVKAIWRLAWDMGIIYGDTEADYEMNRAKLNMFCRQRGTVRKNLTEQNLVELRKTHRQFEAMYTKHKNKVSENERISFK